MVHCYVFNDLCSDTGLMCYAVFFHLLFVISYLLYVICYLLFVICHLLFVMYFVLCSSSMHCVIVEICYSVLIFHSGKEDNVITL